MGKQEDDATSINCDRHQHLRLRKARPTKSSGFFHGPDAGPIVCYGPPSTTPTGRIRSPRPLPALTSSSQRPSQRTAAIAANNNIAQSKGGRIQIVDSNLAGSAKSKRKARSWNLPKKPEPARKHKRISSFRPTKAQQMASHDNFKLDLIAARELEGFGKEGDASKGFRWKEPLYDPESNPSGVEMWKDFAIYRGNTRHRSGAVTGHEFGVAHTPTLTWKSWSSRPSERWIKQQKRGKFDFPDGFYRRVGLSVGKHFQGSPVLVDGKLAFRVEHNKSRRSKIIPLGEIGTQGPCTYHFPKGFDRPGEERGDIWMQARWNAGEYSEGEELADVLDEFTHEYGEMPVI